MGAGIYLHFRHQGQAIIHLRTVEPRLTEIDLVNQSDSDEDLDREISVTWDGGTLVDAGGLAGFDRVNAGDRNLDFRPTATTQPAALHPREARAIGWIRLSDDSQVHAAFNSPP